jgi:Flp pilus assembly protein TadG
MRKSLAPRRLGRDDRGIGATEFGLILPAFAIMLMGGFDLGHTLYSKTVLEGALQKAARDSSLETGVGRQAQIDLLIRQQLLALNKDAQITISRRFYRTFSTAAAAQAEPDANGNGRCETGEVYSDVNGNGTWDRDGGDAGQGGARDIVVITVTMSHPRLFPVAGLIGLSPNSEVTGKTVLQNQPFGRQGSYATPVQRQCPMT